MANDQLKAIVDYVRDVLGVDSFAPATGGMLPPQAPIVESSVSTPYVFIASYDSSKSGLTEMQERMVAALKLKTTDVSFLNLEQTKVELSQMTKAKVIVVFGVAALSTLNLSKLKIGEQVKLGSSILIFTHALQDLENSAAYKKETWTHLQSVLH